MIRNRALGSSFGLMGRHMKGNGITEGSMGSVCLHRLGMKQGQNVVSGLMGIA
jgi:hypothetical protein